MSTAARDPGLFTSATPGLTSTIPTIVAEYTANAATQSFGIFFGNDTSNILSYSLIPGSATVGGAVGVTILGDTLTVLGGTCAVAGGCTYTDGRINSSSFGFFFQSSPTAPIYYSLDQLNASDPRPDRVVAFQDGTTTNWLFSYEDGDATTGDFDYNDMAVKVESIAAVPEPETYAMLLAGLGAMGFVARRRKSSR
ncbi:MAG TPA: PEP-CTERM sorting domain-containing protein [Caldimonas sp.]